MTLFSLLHSRAIPPLTDPPLLGSHACLRGVPGPGWSWLTGFEEFSNWLMSLISQSKKSVRVH
jgi:hypothetical protein